MRSYIMKRSLIMTMAGLGLVILASCGGGEQKTGEQKTGQPEAEQKEEVNKGIGPVDEITLGELDMSMAEEGRQIFDKMCTACHKPREKFIGPAPEGILDRRSPEWIMNMILNPEEMVKKDPIAKQLLVEYNLAPMANQGLTRDEARKILEYFRTLE